MSKNKILLNLWSFQILQIFVFQDYEIKNL